MTLTDPWFDNDYLSKCWQKSFNWFINFNKYIWERKLKKNYSVMTLAMVIFEWILISQNKKKIYFYDLIFLICKFNLINLSRQSKKSLHLLWGTS